MPITINGNGTIGGITAGGLPDGTVDADMLAANAVTNSKILNGTVERDKLEALAKGSILQVKQSVKTDRSSCTGYNWTDTGLSVDITPISTTSNMLVMANIHLGGSVAYDMKLKLNRSYAITPQWSDTIGVGDGAGGRPAVTSVLNLYSDVPTTASYQQAPTGISFLDTTVVTTYAGAITYKVQFASYDTNVVYVNRSSTFNEDTGATPHEFDGTPISTLTVMEVAV